ncbi:uncharacterized protein OCT59_026883 [Rhizophagus irregularis]|uniref:uncharacterized protein n=1 Tax=Rhizophagus irregularis TaxID=588596 RepID=UPI0033185B21|nr:hypothetical protein OCT59_026883 [Rhizophagus irregularis]
MIGTWQIDDEEVKAKNFLIEDLGICYSHFLYDQNQLHSSNLKQTKDYMESIKKDPNCDNLLHHKNDTKKALEVIGYWIFNIANSDNLAFQEKILAHLAPILCIINIQEKSETTSSMLLSVQNIKNEVPSLFIILIILILVKFNYNFDKKLNSKNLTSKHFFEFGEALAHSIILVKNELKIHKKLLESPTSIKEYRFIFPLYLVQFYDGLLKTLYETKKKL